MLITELIRFSRSWSQRSRSQGNGHRNDVNSIAREQLRVFDQKLAQILNYIQENWLCFQRDAFKGQCHRNVRRRRHTDRRFAVEDYLILLVFLYSVFILKYIILSFFAFCIFLLLRIDCDVCLIWCRFDIMVSERLFAVLPIESVFRWPFTVSCKVVPKQQLSSVLVLTLFSAVRIHVPL